MAPNSELEQSCASRVSKAESGAETSKSAKHVAVQVFRRHPSKSSAVATAAAQAATTTKPASMTGLAKTWLARLRRDSPPGTADKLPTASTSSKAEGTKRRSAKHGSFRTPQQSQQLQQTAPKHELLAELVLEARATAEQAVTATQLKAEQLAAAMREVQQQLADVHQKSALLERLCDEADEAVKAAADDQQQLSANKQLLNVELHDAKTTHGSQADHLTRLTAELREKQMQLAEAKQRSGQLQQQLVEQQRGTEKIVLTELIAQLETARAAQAVKESNIQGLTAELAAVRKALVDAENRRAKIEGLYEQATAAALGMLTSQQQLTMDLDSFTSQLSTAHTAQAAKEDQIQQLNAEMVARQKHLEQVVARCVRLEDKYSKSKASKRQASEANQQLSQELAAAVADQEVKAAELQKLNAELQHMMQQLEEAAGTTDKLQQLCYKAASCAESAASTQQQLSAEMNLLSGELLQARADYQAQQSRLEEVSAELSGVQDQLAAAQQTIKDLEIYYQQAIGPSNVNWQACLLYGQEASGLLQEASIVTEPSRPALLNSAPYECRTQEAPLSPEFSTAVSSTQQGGVSPELSTVLGSSQQELEAQCVSLSPELSDLSTREHEDEAQRVVLKPELSTGLNSTHDDLDSQITLTTELSTAFYSARGEFDAHKATLSAELSETQALQFSQGAKISELTAQLSRAEAQMEEAAARIVELEALCAKADAAVQSASETQDHLTADKADLQRQLLNAESSAAEQQQKLQCMSAELAALQQQLKGAHERIETLEQRCLEASHKDSSAAGSARPSSGSGRPSQADQLQALLVVLAAAVQQLEVAEAVSCSLQQQIDSVAADYQKHLTDKSASSSSTTTSSSSSSTVSDPENQPRQLSADTADLCQQLAAAQQVQASQKAALQALMEELTAAREDLLTAEAEIQQLCEQIHDPPLDVQQLTEELDIARAAQAAQQVKLLELTAELKRVQQQLLGAEERSAQLEQLYEEVSDAGFAAQPKPPPPRTQALLEELASLRLSESAQAAKLQQLTAKLNATQQQLVEVQARCLELEDECSQAQMSEAEATTAQQQLQTQMHEHQESLNAAKSSMAAQRVKMQNLKCELEAARAVQEVQHSHMASMEGEIARLKKMLFERDPDAAYKAAVRHMDSLDPATKVAISNKLHYYSLYPKPDRTANPPMEPKLAKTLLKCISYAPAVRSILVLKQILQLDGVSHFGAYLLKGAAKLLVIDPKRFQMVQPKQSKPGTDEACSNLTAGRSASNNGRAGSSNGSSSRWDNRRGSDPGFCSVDVDKLLTAAVPYALEGERLHQHERTQSIIVATCLLQNGSSSSTSAGSGLHYSGCAADPMYWHEAIEAVAETDASVRKDIIQMIQAGHGSFDHSDNFSNLQFVSNKAWVDCLRGIYWLDTDYTLARSLLGLEGLVTDSSAAAAAAGSDEPDLPDGSSSSTGAGRAVIEVLKDLAERYCDHVNAQGSLTSAAIKPAGISNMRCSNGFKSSSSGGRAAGRLKRSGAGSGPGVRVRRHHSGSQT